jgi:HEPN/RES N-terminal domain 1/RES domain
MGMAKQMLIRQMELGFAPIGKKLCYECIGDYALKEFIKKHATATYCDYCDRENDVISANVDDVLEYIIKCLKYEWGNPDDEGVWYDSSEGGYQGTEIYDGWDFVNEILFYEVEIRSDSLLDDIRDTLVDSSWCKKDPYALSLNEEVYLSWQLFCEQVKYKTRYFFYETLEHNRESGEFSPAMILDFIADVIRDLNLIKNVSNQTFYRARVSSKRERFTTAKDLGTPPKKHARFSNRMSPAGIPMFYGAINENTALKEVGYTEGIGVIASIGEFVNTSEIRILDLTELPNIPSIFDLDNRHKRWVIKFLYNFLFDLTKPIKKDGREHIEYVPTQIVTEYFRYVFKTDDNHSIDGIAYPSSTNNNKAYVLFFGNEECVEQNEIKIGGRQLYLKGCKHIGDV